jgi:nucleotide-binding universal stress UspA family protein
MFKTIVVGVDAREGGRDALSLAGRLALVNGGELVAVRALPLDYYISRGGAPAFSNVAVEDAKAQLRAALEAAELEARIVVVGDSSPARALHRVAEDERADVIVVGSTHRGRIGAVLAGDDAAATLHGAPCPVAVAPHGLAGRDWAPVAKIGVGFDGSPESNQALALALDVAQSAGAEVLVRSVVEAPPPMPEAADYDDESMERARAAAVADLREALDGSDAETSGAVIAGTPVQALTILSERVDLLVVGSRAWGPVRRILLGSTAVALMREARCPLLVLPRGAATGQPGEADPPTSPEKSVATA